MEHDAPSRNAPVDVRAEFDKLLACVHCGLCLDACPTYQVRAVETDSPRGRLYLMRALAEGRIGLSDAAVGALDRCLLCRACETACPSGVRYGDLMAVTRERVDAARRLPWLRRTVEGIVLRHLFTHPRRLALLAVALRTGERLGILAALRRSALVRRGPAWVGKSLDLLPPLPARPFRRNVHRINPADGPARRRVALFSCCVNDQFLSEVDFATLRLLQRNGCEVVVLDEQKCSGALHVHAGDGATARALARHNIDCFAAVAVDAIVTNSAGCGTQVREYGELLRDDPAYAAKARRFSAKVWDILEYLDALGMTPPAGTLDRTVAYADACHLAHAQGVRRPPRDLLAAVPGLQLVEPEGPDTCCGSAGIYNLLHPELSDAILRGKIDSLARTGASVIATANPGCLMQIALGCREYGLDAEVVHPVVLLERAHQAAESET